MKNFIQKNYAKLAVAVSAIGMIAMSGVAGATITPDSVSTSFSDIAFASIQAIVGAIVTFFTNNLPVIVVLGTVVGLVWYFVHKARSAGRGR